MIRISEEDLVTQNARQHTSAILLTGVRYLMCELQEKMKYQHPKVGGRSRAASMLRSTWQNAMFSVHRELAADNQKTKSINSNSSATVCIIFPTS